MKSKHIYTAQKNLRKTDLDQGIIEVLDILRCNLVVSDGAKHNVPDVFCWI